MNFSLLNHQKKYLIAVSFGPDSLALLDMLYQAKYQITVAHVNYHKRPVSDLEQTGLEQYCLARDIPIYILEIPPQLVTQNFQAWARHIRYRFFQEIYEANSFDALLTAHHLDDNLETIIMQEKRKIMTICKGICSENTILGMKVIRPLLDESKANLLSYCLNQQLDYATDMSNETDAYERNKVRHHVIPKLTNEERKTMLEQANEHNLKTRKLMINLSSKLNERKLPVTLVFTLDDFELFLTLHILIEPVCADMPISRALLIELRRVAHGSKSHWRRHLRHDLWLIRSYDSFEVIKGNHLDHYEYTLASDGVLDTPYFYLDFSRGSYRNLIKENDYPIVIRNAQTNDSVLIDGHPILLRRLFIDWKLPRHRRPGWPVIVNKDGIIKFVPRYQKDFKPSDNPLFYVK